MRWRPAVLSGCWPLGSQWPDERIQQCRNGCDAKPGAKTVFAWIGGEGEIAAAILAAGPSGPALRAVQNRSRRFCRTRLSTLWVRIRRVGIATCGPGAKTVFVAIGGEGGIRTHG